MKKIQVITAMLLMIFFYACSEKDKSDEIAKSTELKSDSINTIILSQETNLRNAELLNVEIKIPTAICGICEKNIYKALIKIDGIKKVDADADLKIVKVKFDGGRTTTDEIRKTIAKAGYNADNVNRDKSAYDKLDECCKIENKKHS